MNNPANFGIAKSSVMMGMERGFDLSNEEGINEWMETYNAELTSGAGLRIPLPCERDEDAQQFHNRLRRQKAKGRRKRNHKRK